MAAIRSSQRLAHLSTVRNVDRLIYCVRDGYRSSPAAMAARLKSYELDCGYEKSCIEGLHTGFRLDLD